MTRSKLDELVRRSLLSCPTLFATRWDVLVHLYLTIGNGYEWVGGELVDVCTRGPWDEEKARAEFFRGADYREQWWAELGEGLGDYEPSERDQAEARLTRARLQFQLDHLDDLVLEGRSSTRLIGEIGDGALRSIHTEYSYAFNVPDDAEASFRAGAVEVLRELMPLLAHRAMAGTDGGLRAAVGAQLHRLEPVATEAMQKLLRDILGDED